MFNKELDCFTYASESRRPLINRGIHPPGRETKAPQPQPLLQRPRQHVQVQVVHGVGFTKSRRALVASSLGISSIFLTKLSLKRASQQCFTCATGTTSRWIAGWRTSANAAFRPCTDGEWTSRQNRQRSATSVGSDQCRRKVFLEFESSFCGYAAVEFERRAMPRGSFCSGNTRTFCADRRRDESSDE